MNTNAYRNGIADFFAGIIRVPSGHPDVPPTVYPSVWELYKASEQFYGIQADYYAGYMDARAKSIAACEGTLPPSIQPMPPVHVVPASIAAADDDRKLPRSQRRKSGNEVVIIRVNASGMTLSWRKHLYILDLLPEEERNTLIANLANVLKHRAD